MSSVDPLAPSGFTKILVADQVVQIPGGPASGTAAPTVVGGVPVAACLEMQSTTGLGLLPRMTTAQIAAATPQVNGMMVYNTTVGAPQFIQATSNLDATPVINTVPNFGGASGTVTLTGDVTGSGPVGTNIVTTVPALGANPVISQRLVFPLTAAQINVVSTTPLQIIAGVPGATIIVNTWFLKWNFNAIPANNGAEDLRLQYGNAAAGLGQIATENSVTLAEFRAVGVNTIFGSSSFLTAPGNAGLQEANSQSLGIFLTNRLGDFAFGAGNTFVMYIDYEVFVGI